MIDELPAGSKIALDTVVLIYFLEGHPEHGPRTRSLLQRIETGELEAIMSSLVLTELLVPLYQAGRGSDAALLTKRLQRFRHLEINPVSSEIAAEAARIRAEYRLRTPDAIHAATAKVAAADALITNDRDFLLLRPELRVWLLSED